MTSQQQNPAQTLEAPEGLNPGPPQEASPPLQFEDLPQDLRRECLFRAIDKPRVLYWPAKEKFSVLNEMVSKISKVRA
jgi:hypothetical protein